MSRMRGAGALINAGINYAAYKNSNGSVSGFFSSMVKYQTYVFLFIISIVALIFIGIAFSGGKVTVAPKSGSATAGFQNQNEPPQDTSHFA